MGWRARARARRAERALQRQLDYQRRKAAALDGKEQAVVASMVTRAAAVRARIEAVRAIPDEARALEVGSGAHGLIFCFAGSGGVGVDPLADHYAALFPAWQGRARTVAAYGEALPFADSEFDLVLCDNVVDHAERPDRIVAEMARVLKPGGLLYFTVNVHHPVYHAAATLHAGWRALGLPFEITPFADHTVHLTPAAARRLFDGVPLRRLSESEGLAEAKRAARLRPPRHAGDRLKRLFYKNALYETIAVRG
jgi:SAM-dependent methyltransferase